MFHLVNILRTFRRKKSSSDQQKNFLIGIQAGSQVTSGRLNLAMVAFWESMLTENDITSIYKSGKISFQRGLAGLSLVHTSDISIRTRSKQKQSVISPQRLARIKTQTFFLFRLLFASRLILGL